MFRTEIHIQPSEWKISHADPIFSMGSCFSVHIGEKLSTAKFQTLTNPFGVIYNPVSLLQLIEFSVTGKRPESWSYLHHQGVFRNYLFHSEVSSTSEIELQKKVENTFKKVKDFLQQAHVILLTFGSAITYRLKSNNEIVANCHKVPAREFEKETLKVSEIVESSNQIFALLKKINPDVKIILTVSPVRHLKETLELNGVSKAVLRLACEELKSGSVSYFPSYEIMMDDLRDYRFYAEDMLHPTQQTINYIWEKFSGCYFEETTVHLIREWEKVVKAIHHRPFYPGSTEHADFVKKTIEKVEAFRPKFDVTKELEFFKGQL